MEERLQKYMARCGVASRRKCEELILEGRVKVNDNIIDTLGIKVMEGKDEVSVDNILIKPEENKIYIMLNKPEGYVTTVKDEKNRRTIMDLVKVEERIFPIGRLDYDSSGLLLLTNDGDIYNKIIHPREIINKEYIAKVKGIFTENELKRFQSGIDIGGYITAEADIRVIKTLKDESMVRVIIHEGKNRQIRKMCSALGHEVLTLRRVSVGRIKLGELPKGKWRYLTEDEIKYLKKL